jgi:hypothetical protein
MGALAPATFCCSGRSLPPGPSASSLRDMFRWVPTGSPPGRTWRHSRPCWPTVAPVR